MDSQTQTQGADVKTLVKRLTQRVDIWFVILGLLTVLGLAIAFKTPTSYYANTESTSDERMILTVALALIMAGILGAFFNLIDRKRSLAYQNFKAFQVGFPVGAGAAGTYYLWRLGIIPTSEIALGGGVYVALAMMAGYSLWAVCTDLEKRDCEYTRTWGVMTVKIIILLVLTVVSVAEPFCEIVAWTCTHYLSAALPIILINSVGMLLFMRLADASQRRDPGADED